MILPHYCFSFGWLSYTLFHFYEYKYRNDPKFSDRYSDRPGQTVQTQIRLLLEEQSDQGLHCLLFQ